MAMKAKFMNFPTALDQKISKKVLKHSYLKERPNSLANDKIIMKNCRKYCPIIRKGLDLQGKNMVYDPSVYLKKYEKNINYR
jgi:hypothetical protein